MTVGSGRGCKPTTPRASRQRAKQRKPTTSLFPLRGILSPNQVLTHAARAAAKLRRARRALVRAKEFYARQRMRQRRGVASAAMSLHTHYMRSVAARPCLTLPCLTLSDPHSKKNRGRVRAAYKRCLVPPGSTCLPSERERRSDERGARSPASLTLSNCLGTSGAAP